MMDDVDIALVQIDLEACTVFCSDGVTRKIVGVFNEQAEPTDDANEIAIIAVRADESGFFLYDVSCLMQPTNN